MFTSSSSMTHARQACKFCLGTSQPEPPAACGRTSLWPEAGARPYGTKRNIVRCEARQYGIALKAPLCRAP